jgi:hypothetical protein
MVYQPHLKKDLQAQLNAEVAARKAEQAGVTIATTVRDKLDSDKEQVRTITHTLIKAIPVYVPEGTGMACLPQALVGSKPGEGDGSSVRVRPVLPLGFVRLHDYASAGIDPPVPAPTGIDLTGPSGVGLPELSATVVGNYGKALEWRAEVLAWRKWYREQSAAWPKAPTPK